MKILINLSPLKRGGGQNVGLNFLEGLRNHSSRKINEYVFLVSKGSRIDDFLTEFSLGETWKLSANPVLRILQERALISRKIRSSKIDIIYSYFGYGHFSNGVPQVIGSADSNLYYPEIDFWSDYLFLKKMSKKLIDQYRVYGLRNSSHIVFENDAIRQRAFDIYGLANTTTILPSIVDVASEDAITLPVNGTVTKKRILFFCGWQLNKNVMLIPEIAERMEKLGMSSQFIFTTNMDNSPLSKKFSELIRRYGVDEYVKLIGSVDKKQIYSLYSQVDAIVLLSRLESFSNNFIEGWKFRCPMVVTDADWSRRICGDSAIYVDRDSPDDVANAIVRLFQDSRLKEKLTAAGYEILSRYPSITQRIDGELELLRSIATKKEFK